MIYRYPSAVNIIFSSFKNCRTEKALIPTINDLFQSDGTFNMTSLLFLPYKHVNCPEHPEREIPAVPCTEIS